MGKSFMDAKAKIFKQSVYNKLDEMPNKINQIQKDYSRRLQEQEDALRLQQQRQSVVFDNINKTIQQSAFQNLDNQINQSIFNNSVNNMGQNKIIADTLINSKKVTPLITPARYVDTGKKYGDYYSENYEKYKDVPIYQRDDGKYYLKTKNGYERIGKLDEEGNVDYSKAELDKNNLLGNYQKVQAEKQKSVQEAKKAGFVGTSKVPMSPDEINDYWDTLYDLQDKYKLTDDEVNDFWKEDKVSKKIDKNDENFKKVLKLNKKLHTQINDEYDNLDIENRIFLDTFKGTEKERRQMVDFLTGSSHSIEQKDEDERWFKNGKGNFIENTVGTVLDVGQQSLEGLGNIAERGGDLLTYPLTWLEEFGGQQHQVTTDRMGNKTLENKRYKYEYRGNTYWYDPKKHKLYDDSGTKEISRFNLNVMKPVYEYENEIGNLGKIASETAGQNDVDELFENNDFAKWIEEKSYLGSKSRGAIESNVESLGSWGFAGSPALSNLYIFANAYSASREEGIRKGLSNKDNALNSFVNASAETVSENFFDNMPTMSTAGWANGFEGKVARNIERVTKNTKIGRFFYKTLSGAEEGSEEIISNMLSDFGTDLIGYFDNDYLERIGYDGTGNPLDDATAELLSSDTWDSFIAASLGSAMINASSSYMNSRQQNEMIQDFANENGLTMKEAKFILNVNVDELMKDYIPTNDFEDRELAEASARADILYKMTTNAIKANIEVSEDGLSANFYGKEIKFEDLDNEINELVELSTTIEEPDLKASLISAAGKLQFAKEMQIKKQNEINKIQNKVNNVLDFYDKDMTLEDIEQKIKEVEKVLKDKALTEDLRTELENGRESLEEARKSDVFKEKEVQEKQPDVVKDTQKEESIQENEVKLEKLKADQSENEKTIKGLEQELSTLEKQEDAKQLENTIKAKRRAIDDLQERYETEKKKFGMTDETQKLQKELFNANLKLQQLIQEQKSPTQSNEEQINEIKKQIEDLKSKDNTKEIERLEKEIESQKNTIEEEPLSEDEIGAEIETEVEPIKIEQPKHAEILSKMPTEDKKIKDNIKETFEASGYNIDKAMTNFVSSYYPFEKLARKVKNETLLPALDNMANSESKAQSDIKYKQRDLNGNIVGKGLQEIWKAVEKAGLTTEFDYYLGLSRQATKAADRADVFGEDVTSEDAKELVKEMERDYPQFKEWKQDVLKYEKNLRNIMVESGLISQKTSDYLEQLYPEYVRIYRDVYGSGSPIVREGNRIRVKSPVKTAKGGTQNILPFKDALAKQTLEVNNAAYANMFGNELYNVLGGAKTKYKQEGIKNNLVKFTDGDYGYVFYKNGKQTTVKINETMKQALDNSQLLKKGLFTKITGTAGAIQRGLITNFNMLFALTNMPKDLFDAFINTKNPVGFAWNYPRAWALMLSRSKLWKTYVAMGGMNTSVFNYNKGFLNDSTLKKIAKSPIAAAQFLGEHAEQVTRFAEFLNTLSHDGTMAQAMYNASEITVNFKKGGKITKQLSRFGINYMNAAILGTYKAYENFANRKGMKAKLKFVAQMAIFGVLPALANQFAYGDDDDYVNLPDEVKDKNYLIKINDHDFLKIPKGRINSIISYIPQRLYEGRDIDFKKYTGFTLDQIGPSNPIESNIYFPLLNVIANGNKATNYFGSEIIPARYKNKTLEDQRKDPKLTSFSKKMSEMTGMSPFIIDYLYDSYSGFVGDITMPWMTEQADKNALSAKFIVDSITNNKYTTEMYDLEDKYTYPKTDDDLIKYKYISSKTLGVSDYYTEIRNIQSNSDLSDSEKREKIQEVRMELNKYAEDAVNMVKNEKITNKTIGGIKYKQLGTKDATGNTYMYKYNEDADKWEKVAVNSKEYKQLTK